MFCRKKLIRILFKKQKYMKQCYVGENGASYYRANNDRTEKCKHLLHQKSITLMSSDHYKFTSKAKQLKLEEKIISRLSKKNYNFC
jgi:hypothetical protein